ncbi:asparagine--tRNA ligase [Candidatus Micrarchaeota archaeon]|nr:asparagine--tRNA ligase [Candidatus Micrarchaeota archaeon]
MITNIGTIFHDRLEGKDVALRGWVHRHRVSGNMAFIVMRDPTGIIQVTVKKDKVCEKDWKDANGSYVESSFTITGRVKKDERAPGGYEIEANGYTLISQGEPFPIAKDLSEEFLLDIRHLWMRSQKMTNVMKARHHIVNYLREFFETEGFYELAPPIITRSGCEGGSTLFEMDYFGEKAYLTQSSQMYAEVFIFSLGKVYVLAPSFRAEKSRTIRHLAEYWHLEPEMAFYDYKMNMDLQEAMVKYAVGKMVGNYSELLKACGRDPEDLRETIEKPFERMDYEVAVEEVNELGGKMEWGQDFGADEEALLTKGAPAPMFVTRFPKEIKAFYMKEDPNKPEVVLNDDLLAPAGHGEIIGGSERIWHYDELIARMKEQNLKIEDYQWYVDLRRFGSVPHSGFGLGIERFVKWTLNLEHIRDTIPFPRTINRCYP